MPDTPQPAPPARPLDPRWVPGVPFTARRRPDGTFAVDAPAAEIEAVLEVTPAELGTMLTDRAVPFVRQDVAGFWESVRQSATELTPWRREVHARGVRTGRDIWVRVHAVPRAEADGAVAWEGLVVDVTDLKQAEERLWKAYQQLSSHIDNTPLAVLEWDREFRVLRWAGQAERVFGWTAAEVVGRPVFGFPIVHPDDMARVGGVVADLTGKRALRNRSLNRNLTKGGETIVCEWYNSVVFDEAGAAASYLSLALDVTARERSAAALVRSEERLRAALDAARMLVLDWDMAADRLEFSSPFADFFGIPPGSDYATRAGAKTAIHPDDLAAVQADFETLFARPGDDIRQEFRGAVPGPDGRPRWFAVQGRVARDPTGKPTRLIAVTTEVTAARRAAEEREAFDRQLREAQKLESLGVLSGGLAHDFNNLLTIVLGNAGLTRKAVPHGSPAQGYLDQVEAACQRAANLCRQMLAYAGRGQMALERVDLNRVIGDSTALVGAAGLSRVRVDVRPADGLPTVAADLAQVRQVVVNLVLNATEAIGAADGAVFVRTGVLKVDGVDADFQPRPAPGTYVALDVVDTGPGMPADVKARLFEPFFTTKFAGRGLGLPAVLGIVKAHGGAVRVDTALGRGTRVRVLLPTADATGVEPTLSPPVVPVPEPRTVPGTEPRAPGLALVVDDEMYVREVAASVLEEMGYETLVAADGPSALELFGRHRGDVRVAVIDVIMPGMTGTQVLERLRAADPVVAAVLISGFTNRAAAGPLQPTGRTRFLQKPFRPEELAAAVQAVVEGTG